MLITYKKMNLFAAPKHSILVHACNCKGMWGSGIAVGFRDRFPASYRTYRHTSSPKRLGTAELCPTENGYEVGCLFTSVDYGRRADSPKEILKNTRKALIDFRDNCVFNWDGEVYSNKFNSGLFNVPWPETAALIEEVFFGLDFEWIVCDPDM